ncbi:MAG: hypothetical protein J6C80_00500 [Flavobacteriales bacterium]|nr:hypothetical protein [Flavobacteriales bacterium]
MFNYCEIKNHVYRPREDNIKIISKSGEVNVITEISEQINFTKDKTETKVFICFPKEFRDIVSIK